MDFDKLHYECLKTAGFTFLTFYALNKIVFKILTLMPAYKTNTNVWRLKNTIISFTHAVVCSILVSRSWVSSLMNIHRLQVFIWSLFLKYTQRVYFIGRYDKYTDTWGIHSNMCIVWIFSLRCLWYSFK